MYFFAILCQKNNWNEMTKLSITWRTWTTAADILNGYLEFIDVS